MLLETIFISSSTIYHEDIKIKTSSIIENIYGSLTYLAGYAKRAKQYNIAKLQNNEHCEIIQFATIANPQKHCELQKNALLQQYGLQNASRAKLTKDLQKYKNCKM